MIAFFNKLGNSWIAKIICAVLAISMMAFWGLGGLSITSGSSHIAAKVGRQTISLNVLNQVFESEKNQLAQIMGTYLSNKQAIENGLLEQVVQKTVTDSLENQIHDKVGLIASDAAVRKYVERNPLFQDNLGNFDNNLFYAYLGQLKMNQVQLAEKLKTELAKQHLSNALLKSVPQNQTLMNIVAATQKEKRKVSYFVLKQSDIPVTTPTTAELKEYYEAYQENFMTPEYRKLHVMTILPSDFKGEDAYDKMYKTVQNLEDLLGAGTSLAQASQKLNLSVPTELTVDIGGKNKQGSLADKRLKDNTLLQEAFVLSANEATAVLDYENGFIVAEVIDIIPVAYKPFETVKQDVEKLYKQEQQKDQLPIISQKIMQSLSDNKGWGKYAPKSITLDRFTQESPFKNIIQQIFAQKTGQANAQLYPLNNGNVFIVVDSVLREKKDASAKEKSEAINIFANDLELAVQQNYQEYFPITINHEAIKKHFITYKEE